MRLPVRILLWVVAFVLGALVVRFFAKVTGFAGGDTFFDLLIDGKLTTYLRLFALVPVWALFATLFATAMIDGPRAWASRRNGQPSATAGASAATAGARRPKPRPAPAPSASPAAKGAAVAAGAAAARSARSIPRREPAPVAVPGPKATPVPAARMPDPPPVAPVVAKTAAVPAATERADDAALDFGARAASGQRPRRIPRRGVGS
jgi:hypothetical protein